MSEILVNFIEGDAVLSPIALALDLAGEITGEVKTRVVSSPFSLALQTSGEVDGEIKTEFIRKPISLNLTLSGDLRGALQRQTSINFNLKLSGEMSGEVRLAVAQPPPVLEEVAEDAFTKQFYAARLLGDNVVIDINSATVEEPKGAIGKRVSAQISKKELPLITPAKRYKFQIGKRATWNGPVQWETVLENAELDSRSYTQAWGTNAPADSLSFSTIAPLSDRINRFPTANFIFYNPKRAEFSLDQSERVKIDGGGFMDTEVIRNTGLTLYDVLQNVRKRTGYFNIVTNIPNYELTRVDFPFTQSWNDSLKGILGTFEVLPRMKAGNVLELLDKTQEVPDGFNPRAIYLEKHKDLNLNMPSGGTIDGFVLSYVVSNSNANFYVDRTVQTREETGIFGAANYTRTEISRTFRDWKNLDDPEEILRVDLIRENHSIYNNALILIGRETNQLSYDAQGKRTSSLRTVESRVPNLETGGTPALLTTRTETQTISYTTDTKNPRRQFQSKTITQIRGLVAVDAENRYFEEDFRQDFSDANRAGNLTATMTSEFAPIRTITETLTPLGNNQFEVRASTVDHLRNTTVNAQSEPKTGDTSLASVGGKTKQIVILREGLTAPTGRPLVPFAIGELPLSLGKPLARRRLKRIIDRKQDGTVNIIGYDSSLTRGVYFRLFDRAQIDFGRFLAEGTRSVFDNLNSINQTVLTTVDISEV